VVADVAICGGGPAGAALAIALGRRGVRVALYERAQHPRLKACGEGLLPHGVEALGELAPSPGARPDAPRVRGLRFVAGDASVEADFPDGAHGLIVRRDRFDAWLFALAAATPNVDARDRTPYRRDGARLEVGADGRRSRFHRRLRPVVSAPARVGLSAHVGGIEGLGDRVEVFFHPDGELYLAPAGGGEALVSVLQYRERFRRDGVLHLLTAIPELRARAARAELTTPVLAAAPLGLRLSRIVDGDLLLIGDAAGAPDPITGEGIALALCSAAPAADAIVSGDLLAYARRRLAMGRTADRLGRMLLWMAGSRAGVAGRLLRRPALAPVLLDVALGRRPLSAATLVRAFR